MKMQEAAGVSPGPKQRGAGSKRRVIGASSVERPALGQNGVSLTNVNKDLPGRASLPTGTQKKKGSKAKQVDEDNNTVEENPFKIEGDSVEGTVDDVQSKKKKSKKSKKEEEPAAEETKVERVSVQEEEEDAPKKKKKKKTRESAMSVGEAGEEVEEQAPKKKKKKRGTADGDTEEGKASVRASAEGVESVGAATAEDGEAPKKKKKKRSKEAEDGAAAADSVEGAPEEEEAPKKKKKKSKK